MQQLSSPLTYIITEYSLEKFFRIRDTVSNLFRNFIINLLLTRLNVINYASHMFNTCITN